LGISINGNNKSIASINSADTIYFMRILSRPAESQPEFVPRQTAWYSIGDVQGSILNSLTLVNDSAAKVMPLLEMESSAALSGYFDSIPTGAGLPMRKELGIRQFE
jgi:hypothetical protein